MKRVHLSADSALRDIFAYEESRAVFDKFLPGMRARTENQAAVGGLSARRLVTYSGGAIPAAVVDGLNAALTALELYSDEPDIADTPLTVDGAEVVAEPPRDAIYPGRVWRDTNGRRIQAHGGAIFYEDGVYYWYGENKDHTDGKCPVWTWGIRAYRSTDLYNWEDMGLIILPDFSDENAPLHPTSHADRPHIVKCAATGKYVCWIKHCGSAACFTVLQADAFAGPYEVKQHHYRPFGYEVGDFDIAVSGSDAYLYMDANHSGVVTLKLSADFLTAEKEICWQYKDLHAPFCREGITVTEHGGKWYMLTSGMTGYVPNKSDSAVADAPDRPFVSVGNPHVAMPAMPPSTARLLRFSRCPAKRTSTLCWPTAGCRITLWTPDWPTFWSAPPHTATTRSATKSRRRNPTFLRRFQCWIPPTPPAPITSGCRSPLRAACRKSTGMTAGKFPILHKGEQKMNYSGSTAPEMSVREKRNAAPARRAAAESYVLLQNPDNTLPS